MTHKAAFLVIFLLLGLAGGTVWMRAAARPGDAPADSVEDTECDTCTARHTGLRRLQDARVRQGGGE